MNHPNRQAPRSFTPPVCKPSPCQIHSPVIVNSDGYWLDEPSLFLSNVDIFPGSFRASPLYDNLTLRGDCRFPDSKLPTAASPSQSYLAEESLPIQIPNRPRYAFTSTVGYSPSLLETSPTNKGLLSLTQPNSSASSTRSFAIPNSRPQGSALVNVDEASYAAPSLINSSSCRTSMDKASWILGSFSRSRPKTTESVGFGNGCNVPGGAGGSAASSTNVITGLPLHSVSSAPNGHSSAACEFAAFQRAAQISLARQEYNAREEAKDKKRRREQIKRQEKRQARSVRSNHSSRSGKSRGPSFDHISLPRYKFSTPVATLAKTVSKSNLLTQNLFPASSNTARTSPFVGCSDFLFRYYSPATSNGVVNSEKVMNRQESVSEAATTTTVYSGITCEKKSTAKTTRPASVVKVSRGTEFENGRHRAKRAWLNFITWFRTRMLRLRRKLSCRCYKVS